MLKFKISFVLVLLLFLNGCVSMKYPEWSKSGFTNEREIHAWQKCGIFDPKTANEYKQCGIEKYKVCGIGKYQFDTPIFSNIPPENACQWNPYLFKVGDEIGSNKLILNNSELLTYIQAGINPEEAYEWKKVFKNERVRGWIAYNRLSKGEKGISGPNLAALAKKNNLTPNDVIEWVNICMLQGWKYINNAGDWKKNSITFDELSNAVKYITIHENQFKKTTPQLAKQYKLNGYKFKAIYLGLENDVSVKELARLKDSYNIDYEHGIIYLKYFSVNDIIALHKNFEVSKYGFEKNVKYAKKYQTYGMNLFDVGNWLKYYKPESENDIATSIDYYKNGLSPVMARYYKEMYVNPSLAKQYEIMIQKNCDNIAWLWSAENPFDLNGKCIRLRAFEQKVLLSQQSAIYTYQDSWVKITSKKSVPKYFSGVIKIIGTSKFKIPEGLETIIPSGKVIVNY